MKWVQLLCFSILLPCLIAKNLTCYSNPLREDDPANLPDTFLCDSTNELCSISLGQDSSGKRIIARGCSKQESCDQEDSVQYNGINYAMTYTCCKENHCNLDTPVKGLPSGANGLHLSMAVVLVVGVVNVCMW